MKARLLVAAGLAVPLALLAARARTTDDVLRLLPEDAGSAEAIRVARAFGTADVLLFDVDGSSAPGRLPEVAAALAADLRAVPGIERVDAGLSFEDALAVREVVARHAPSLVPAEALRERTSEAGVRAAYAAWLAELAGPAGALAERRLADDPLRLEALAMAAIGRGVPGEFARGVGALRSRDGDHALVIATSDRSPTDVRPDDPFVAAVAAVARGQDLPVSWYGGARVAAATADAIRADVRRSVLVGLVGLAAVVLVGLRRVAPLLGALGPLAFASLVTAAATGLLSPVHGIQLAFVGTLAGIAVDYWMHLYLAASAEHRDDPGAGRAAAAVRALGHLAAPLALSAGATALAFGALLSSGMPMVRDLGALGLAATAGAVGGLFLLGPLAFALVGPGDVPTGEAPRRPALAGPLALAIGALGAWGLGGEVDPDPSALLTEPPGVAALEWAFHDTWGLGDPRGMAVIRGPDEGGVRDRARRVEAALSGLGFVDGLGPGAVVPGPATRAERAAALPPVEVLQERIDRVAAEMGFVGAAGAAARIHAAATADLPGDAWSKTALGARVQRHLVREGDGWAALVTVPLVDPLAEPLLGDAVRAADPEARWVVPTDLAGEGIGRALSALGRSAPWAAALVLGFLFLRMRRSADVLRAVAPLAAALACAAGAMAVAGLAWNVVSLAGLVLIVGLSVDYGVFVVEARAGGGAVVRRAIALSAGTTLAGFLGLVLAESPALVGLGVAVCAGLLGAAATALVVLPALDAPATGLLGFVRRQAPRLAYAALIGLHLDVLWALWATLRPPDAPDERPPAVTVVGPEHRAGTARLRFTEGVRVLYTEGDPFAAGLAYGALTVDLRHRVEEELFRTFADRVPSPVARWAITRGSMALGGPLYEAIRPEDRLHLAGVVAAAPDPWTFKGDPFTRRVYYHALHDLGQALVDTPLLAACTGFVATGRATADGHALLARNFDFEGGVTFDRDKVVWVHRPVGGHAFLAVGFAGMIGAVSGVNDQGLAVAINAAGSSDPIRAGTPMTLIVREILETADSLDEAEAVLRARTGFVAENVLVVDGDADAAAVFEVTPARVVRLDVPAWRAVSNHFTSPELADDPVNQGRMREITTLPRLARMEELVGRAQGRLDPAVAAAILSDRRGVGDAPLPAGHRHALDADIATHSVVIDATARRVWVSRFPNLAAGFVAVDLDDVLAGNLDATEVVPPRPHAAQALAVAAARERLRRARRLPPEAALVEARAALRDLPEHPEALFETGRLLAALGRADEARPLLERALAAPPEYAWQAEAIRDLLESP